MIIVRVGFATDKRIVDLEGSTNYRPAGLKLAQRKDKTQSSRLQSGIDTSSGERKSLTIELTHYVDDPDAASVRPEDKSKVAFDLMRLRGYTV